jgi:hypothetical protein
MVMTRTSQVILLDSSGNNPVIAKRTVRRTGQFSYRFPLHDKEGNEITEEQASRKKTKSLVSERKIE